MATASNVQDPPHEQLQPLINLFSQGQLQLALNQATEMLRQFPRSVTLHNICGAAHAGLWQFDAAIESYKQAIKIKPDYPLSYNNMGIALKEKGDVDAAIDSYKIALKIKSDYAEAYNNMGNALKEKGDLEAAIDNYKIALKIKSDYADAYFNMGTALNGVVFTEPQPDLLNLILRILEGPNYARPVHICKAALSLLKLDSNVKAVLGRDAKGKSASSLERTISEVSKTPLLLKLMEVCPLVDLELEALLKGIRSDILLSISSITNTTEILNFQIALALQCFTNEYLYDQTDAETEVLNALEVSVERNLSDGKQPTPSQLACLASYKVLHEYSWSNLLSMPTELDTLYARQILEPEEEQQLRTEMPVLQEISNSISSKVREQYEENPYPRWVNLGLSHTSKPISEITKELHLRLTNTRIYEVDTPQILVAGCGTGQQSISTSSRFKDCNVLAIDLSLSSLSYAKRKTEGLGVTNIEYLQADILDLGKLERQFDIVECTGVLHHMDDPMAGWRVLTRCLKTGGLMKIGLYSKLARQDVVSMREEINQLGIESNKAAMKSFRKDVINLPREHHKRILSSSDFYSLSALRDLLFHAQEHHFTIPQIQGCLAELGLELCGFEDRVVQKFKSQNLAEDDIYDLEKWNAFEGKNPHIFGGMYQFWCQKVN